MYVTLEGIDGSGKSTLGAALAQALRSEGVRVKQSEEPTRTWLGESVRRGIREGIDPAALLLLFMADRAEHVRRVQDWEAQGYLVLSDRYADSTIAYQAVALADRFEEPLAFLGDLQWRLFPKPSLTLWLDVPVEQALARIRDRERHERFERQDFLRHVAANYARLAQAEPKRWFRIDASGAPERAAEAASGAVLSRLSSHKA